MVCVDVDEEGEEKLGCVLVCATATLKEAITWSGHYNIVCFLVPKPSLYMKLCR